MSTPAWLVARPIAHRGLHDRARGIPENTVAAAEAAIAGGFGIECDVQLSRDGEAMVFHDHTLDRLTAETGPVLDRSRAELEAIAIDGTSETIPTLAAFLDRIGGRVPLVVEIKSRFDGDERLARRTVEVLAGRTEPFAVKSFDPRIVALLRQIAPRIRRGIVAQTRYDGPDWGDTSAAERRSMAMFGHWNETRPDFISYRYADLPSQVVVMPRILSGIPVITWTVRSQQEADRASAFADQIVFEGFVPA
ncbi:glycerophosphodiester phosphodiesterase family protein [Enterovirga rhinocerotis]|uniref:Glycerophosphoryl diester phosphodiesterase n=1 Tax=Enterovirga rhinocerotis TaxID=1339210 RepID=A0A4R7CAJ7_9HYPH|nr:glycerophosphodiester phosphodiesterase family protein [Enterovirga rhinocerotis]TDR94395.1 glycerophosphoryl diester phosphodiesterase [Enterovirga rhinocerotis]